ncbi:MAG TPA: hypothetical protein ENN50_02875 [Prosthecochloris aestuarii]|uniref:Efflux transporter, RND family, MFP subunit n=1 Tax=Prosthecochloris aestuarii TaxID=1102 RepID=A0A831WP73_PROAE|nr:hypothetical protein [Prosthecochloris aestuarii]
MKYRTLCVVLALPLMLGACHPEQETSAPPEQEVVIAQVDGISEAVELPGDRMPGVAVPSDAVFRRGQLEGVQVVRGDGTVVIRWVRSGSAYDGMTEILSGIEQGEKVLFPYDLTVKEGYKAEQKQ